MDIQYQELLNRIILENDDSEFREDRTGTGTLSIFGHQMKFDLSEGFPAQTTKKLAWNAVVAELLWFLEGSIDERRLAELTHGAPRSELEGKKTIWTANFESFLANNPYSSHYNDLEDPEIHGLGPVYGDQWRSFGGALRYKDQVQMVLHDLKTNPTSRRIIINAWNASEIEEMALPPCHVMSQYYVKNGKLSCHMYQRSADVFLGLPFNIASYALLTHIFARESGLEVGELIISLGDAHIYRNHLKQVSEVLSREPKPLPSLYIDKNFDLEMVLDGKSRYDEKTNFNLINYFHHEPIKAEMAV